MAKIIKTLIVLGLILGGYLYFVRGDKSIDSLFSSPVKNVRPEPTPFEFEEMTIPYLRDRDYVSALGELSKYSDNSSYASYITNYNSDGLRINGLLTIPKGEKPAGGFPAIVFVHGYVAPTIYKTTERYASYVDFLARNGYVVFKIDLRGHGNSEGEPGGSYYSGDYIIDTLNAYAALQSSDFINKSKVGLWGHSMAGNITLRSFAAKQSIPALAIWGGAGYTYTDLLDYRITDSSYRPPEQNTTRQRNRQKLRELYGEFNKDNYFWKQVPATNYLEGIKGAISLHHAVDDNVVSIEYSRNLNSILDNTSIPHSLYEYRGGGHNINSPYFNQAMADTVAFFDKYLKNNGN